jgi:hypothetical protein
MQWNGPLGPKMLVNCRNNINIHALKTITKANCVKDELKL